MHCGDVEVDVCAPPLQVPVPGLGLGLHDGSIAWARSAGAQPSGHVPDSGPLHGRGEDASAASHDLLPRSDRARQAFMMSCSVGLLSQACRVLRAQWPA